MIYSWNACTKAEGHYNIQECSNGSIQRGNTFRRRTSLIKSTLYIDGGKRWKILLKHYKNANKKPYIMFNVHSLQYVHVCML